MGVKKVNVILHKPTDKEMTLEKTSGFILDVLVKKINKIRISTQVYETLDKESRYHDD